MRGCCRQDLPAPATQSHSHALHKPAAGVPSMGPHPCHNCSPTARGGWPAVAARRRPCSRQGDAVAAGMLVALQHVCPKYPAIRAQRGPASSTPPAKFAVEVRPPPLSLRLQQTPDALWSCVSTLLGPTGHFQEAELARWVCTALASLSPQSKGLGWKVFEPWLL